MEQNCYNKYYLNYKNLNNEKREKNDSSFGRVFLKKDIFKMSKKPKCLLEWRRIFQEKWFC
jgi:hypothetical protein